MKNKLALFLALSTSILWASGTSLIPPLSTKGDVWVYGTGNTRIAVGSDAQCLTADSTQVTGLKWASCGGVTGSGSANQLAYWSSSSVLTGSSAITYDGTTFATSGIYSVTNTTEATTTSAASLKTAGGIAALKGVRFATFANVGGPLNVNDLTASRAVVTSVGKDLVSAATTATEIGYVNGVTSAIQTQMDLKAPIANPSHTGLFVLANASTVTTGNAATITGTLSSAGAGDTTGISALYSTTGGSSRNIYGSDIELAAGSTTAAGAIAGQFFSAVASVPTTLGGANFNACTSNGTGCTVGYRGFARGAGSKTLNIGGYNEATSGATNVAVIGHAPGVADTASFKGIGVVGAVQFPSATPTNFKGVGVWAVLNTTTANYSVASTFPAVNAAIVADNGDTTADVVNFMDGGTTVFKVADAGIVTIGTGTSTQHVLNTLSANVSNCGSLATACIQITVNGATRYIPYF